MSCSADKEALDTAQAESAMEKLQNIGYTSTIIFKPGDYATLEELDAYYRKDVENNTEFYSATLKDQVIKELMKRGLAEHGTPEQKQYYSNETVKLNTAFDSNAFFAPKVFFDPDNYANLDAMDAFYRKEVKGSGKPYSTQEKNPIIKALMDKGLAGQGSCEQIMYYINEITKCDGLYADSASLYTLLLVPDLPQDEALFAIEESFYTKKFNAINKSTWSEEEAKMETLNTLDSSHKKYSLIPEQQ